MYLSILLSLLGLYRFVEFAGDKALQNGQLEGFQFHGGGFDVFALEEARQKLSEVDKVGIRTVMGSEHI